MGRTSLEDRPCSNPSAADAFAKKVLSVIPARGAMRLKLIGSINGVLEVENVSGGWTPHVTETNEFFSGGTFVS